MTDEALIVERAEAAALGDFWLAAPPELRKVLGLNLHDVFGATVFVTGGIDQLFFNRALAVGVDTPATELQLDRIIARLKEAGATNWGIPLMPRAQPMEVREWLNARGLAPVSSSAKVLREPAPAGTLTTALRVTDEPEPTLWAQTVCAAYELPDTCVPWCAALVGRTGWRTYLALDGETAISCGALYTGFAEAAWLGFGGTLPDQRRRGGQGTLMARRIDDAHALRLPCAVTETGAASASASGEGNPSYRNMLKAGFRVVHLRENWAPRP